MENKGEKKNTTFAEVTQFELTKLLINNLANYDITPTAKLVLIYLSNCYNHKKIEMFPKQKTIALKIGISERSVVRSIKELCDNGLLLIECNYSNHYKFTAKVLCEKKQNEKNFEKNKLADYKSQNVSSKSDNLSEHEQKIKQNNKQTVDDFKILQNYAQKKGARNINAYVNYLINNNLHIEILKQTKYIEESKQKRIFLTKKYLEEREKDKLNCAPLPNEWFEFGKKLFNRIN